MNTTLKAEYARANHIIEAVLAGEQPVRITLADATVDGEVRGREVAGLSGVREVFIYQMTAAERARFTHAYEKLYADADQYVLRRPKPSGPLPHHTTIAVESGLKSMHGQATYLGTRAEVLGAAKRYRARGYEVTGDAVTSDATLVVVVSIPEVFTTTLISTRLH